MEVRTYALTVGSIVLGKGIKEASDYAAVKTGKPIVKDLINIGSAIGLAYYAIKGRGPETVKYIAGVTSAYLIGEYIADKLIEITTGVAKKAAALVMPPAPAVAPAPPAPPAPAIEYL